MNGLGNGKQAEWGRIRAVGAIRDHIIQTCEINGQADIICLIR